MGKRQPLSAKVGEVKFRQKLVKQHQGKKVFYPTHASAATNLALLKQRAKDSLKIFKELEKAKIPLSPFLELGGEKCERAAVLTSKMNHPGVSLDLSAESLESAEGFCPQIGLNKLPVRICADAYRLPFADNSFPFVFTFQTLHHFPDPEPIVAEINRVLTPGGLFYCGDEPVKQLANLSLWRRDYQLRWWEKVLKALLVLPFLSTIGKSEVSEGVLEETFDLATWERALSRFDRVEAELIPFPFGPRTKVKKEKKKEKNKKEKNKGWLKPNLATRAMINLCGGGIIALGRKKGKLKTQKKNVFLLFACPDCGGKIKKTDQSLDCQRCRQKYPIKNEILYLLPKALRKKLYS